MLAAEAAWALGDLALHEESAVVPACRRLLDRLGDETLRTVAVWKMEGETNAAIAARLGCVTSTVERKLQRIRDLWTREGIS